MAECKIMDRLTAFDTCPVMTMDTRPGYHPRLTSLLRDIAAVDKQFFQEGSVVIRAGNLLEPVERYKEI